MKFIVLILLFFLNASCTSKATSGDIDLNIDKLSEHKPKEARLGEPELDNLNKAIALARKNKDYRLLVTSGRSISIPGVKSSDYQAVIVLCGKKYNSAVGDVITSEEQRLARKKEVNYMRQYNKQMLVICQENKAK